MFARRVCPVPPGLSRPTTPTEAEPCKSTALNWDFKEKPALFFKQVYKEILIQDNNTCQQCPVIVLPFVVLLGNNFPAGEAPAGVPQPSVCGGICPEREEPLPGQQFCQARGAGRKTSPEGSPSLFTICPSPSLPLFVTKMHLFDLGGGLTPQLLNCTPQLLLFFFKREVKEETMGRKIKNHLSLPFSPALHSRLAVRIAAD